MELFYSRLSMIHRIYQRIACRRATLDPSTIWSNKLDKKWPLQSSQRSEQIVMACTRIPRREFQEYNESVEIDPNIRWSITEMS